MNAARAIKVNEKIKEAKMEAERKLRLEKFKADALWYV